MAANGPGVEGQDRGDPDRSGLTGRGLLLVEENVPLRNDLERAFERQQFEVMAAATLEETYEIACSFVPECFVLDLSLRDGHGTEGTARCRVTSNPFPYTEC